MSSKLFVEAFKRSYWQDFCQIGKVKCSVCSVGSNKFLLKWLVLLILLNIIWLICTRGKFFVASLSSGTYASRIHVIFSAICKLYVSVLCEEIDACLQVVRDCVAISRLKYKLNKLFIDFFFCSNAFVQSFGVHWCPFGSLTRFPLSFE